MSESKWSKFHEQPVAVQLGVSYAGVTEMNQFIQIVDSKGNPIVPSVPFLRGVANVDVSEDGVLMTIRSQDPQNPDRYMNISFDPNSEGIVAFISKGEEPARIVS